MARGESTKDTSPVTSLELIRDIYGFSVRPQHLERYREYIDIYKEEELERCKGWDQFLETHAELGKFEGNGNGDGDGDGDGDGEGEGEGEREGEGDSSSSEGVSEGESKSSDHESGGKAKKLKVEGVWKTGTWGEIRPSLHPLERFMRRRTPSSHISSPMKYGSDVDDPEGEESFDIDRSDTVRNATSQPDTPVSTSAQSVPDALVDLCPLKYELEALVRGGVPMALRGELWQIFVGTGTRRLQGHYDALLMLLADGGGESDGVGGLISGRNKSFYSLSADSRIQEKWTNQIEKDLPRTFPGHPALDESGRNILRRLLTAYARHNPEVGYCQAMNFFAALLLLLMPEENAFWTLAGIIDDYFEGYYSEKMIEAQVDQLVFEDLVQEYFPTIANHLDSLGVQVAWVSSPWFLSIFVNILPWECVLRIWDVLLYEGNRRMLFRTALALMDLHGPAIMATKDAGDAVTLLQSSAGASFDSSQLVLTACMSYQMVDEIRLQELRTNHRPTVLDSVQERAMGLKTSSDSHKGNSSELVKSDVENNLDANKNDGKGNPQIVKRDTDVHGDSRENMTPDSLYLNGFTTNIAADGVPLEAEEDTLMNPLDSEEESIGMDLAEQVKWLKSEVVRVLEENKVATVRAEELQTAFIELVKYDNRQLLTAKIEGLEEESSKLKKLLMEKEEKEQEMIQAMLQMEHMQGVAEQARIYAENDAIAQRHAAEMLQTKYENAISELEAMENRAIIAESMLAATLQYQALGKRQAGSPKICTESSSLGDEKLVKSPLLGIPLSPRRDSDDSKGLSEQGAVPTVNEEQQPKQSPPQPVNHLPKPQGILSRPFSFGWFDRSKGKTAVKDTQNGLSVTPQTSISPQNSLEIQATVAENHTHAKEMETSIHEKDDAASKQDPEK